MKHPKSPDLVSRRKLSPEERNLSLEAIAFHGVDPLGADELRVVPASPTVTPPSWLTDAIQQHDDNRSILYVCLNDVTTLPVSPMFEDSIRLAARRLRHIADNLEAGLHIGTSALIEPPEEA